MNPPLQEIDAKKTGFFRFKKLADNFLITNEIGEYAFLPPREFSLFLSGRLEEELPQLYADLQARGFGDHQANLDDLSRRYALKNSTSGGPDLHIVVVTLRCDHKCVYCQAVTQGPRDADYDMVLPVAEQVVDKIFLTPNKTVTIEFQGGEPLLNFDTVKFIVLEALKKNRQAKKKLIFSLVSNLTFMTRDILGFIRDQGIQVCTSLDGPEHVHNKCRISRSKGGSYKNTVFWLKQLQKGNKPGCSRPNALATITRHSLSHPRAIIDTYMGLGLDAVHLRPMSPFGIPSKNRSALNYTASEFLSFYKEALEHIIALNLKGEKMKERTALIFLTKILTDTNPGFLDLRSPCGAGIGQLAYNYNGDIYTCDEGRMLSRLGDDSFKIGNVSDFTYQKLFDHEVLKAVCTASCLDIVPGCSDCVFRPYCGTCPVCNLKINQDLFMKSGFHCEVNAGILEFLFEKLKNKKTKDILSSWLTAPNPHKP